MPRRETPEQREKRLVERDFLFDWSPNRIEDILYPVKAAPVREQVLPHVRSTPLAVGTLPVLGEPLKEGELRPYTCMVGHAETALEKQRRLREFFHGREPGPGEYFL